MSTTGSTASLAVLHMPMEQLVLLWGELVEAYCGQHAYGGYTAEIYAYRFLPYTPLVHGACAEPTRLAADMQHELQRHAALSLVAICQWFSSVYHVPVTINAQTPEDWYTSTQGRFVHRVHVTMLRKDTPCQDNLSAMPDPDDGE